MTNIQSALTLAVFLFIGSSLAVAGQKTLLRLMDVWKPDSTLMQLSKQQAVLREALEGLSWEVKSSER